ncbi:MAG: cbb3-type cytochrome c oxidase subunit I [Oligoflexus sp.]|jgi:cytochrome c oxidase cbb3-type subunit 1
MIEGTVGLYLAFTFLASVAGLLMLIWSISTGQLGMGPDAPSTIFAAHEKGQAEDPSARAQSMEKLQSFLDDRSREDGTPHTDHDEVELRLAIDASVRRPVIYLACSAIVWLILGSVAGLWTSLKFHYPDWNAFTDFLTFGRLRPFHLNAVIYGWVSQAGMGVALWLSARILKVPLRAVGSCIWGTHLWNLALFWGLSAILLGRSEGIEWLELPWEVDAVLAISGGMIGIPILRAVKERRVHHLYVSIWYIGAAFVWFPLLFLVANVPMIYSGVQHAIVNWWFAHNVLGLWITPLGLGAAYYFIPKVLGKPIHSYQLSLLGFWGLALFYSQVGMHHLIGGPVPTWLITLSIVTSVMMIAPVLAAAINHHMTMVGHFRALRFSPTLAFVVTGAMLYTLVSVQGSFQSIRTFNTITHFTHATVAHAHLGVYGFASFILFGSLYFILPRLAAWEWPFPRLIPLHYWLALSGIMVYFVGLSIGGVLQGLAMLNEKLPFQESVAVTLPYLWARSVGGGLMTLAHIVFGVHVCFLLARAGAMRQAPAYRYIPKLGGRSSEGA